jgi:hypothetical protein
VSSMAVGVSGNERDGAHRWVTEMDAATKGKPELEPMDPRQRPAPTPGLAAGVLNSIVAKGLPHKLLDLLKFVLPGRHSLGRSESYDSAMRAEPDEFLINRSEGFITLWQ